MTIIAKAGFNIPLNTITGDFGDDLHRQSLEWCKKTQPFQPTAWLILETKSYC